MMHGLLSYFLPSYPTVLIYMLQATEYDPLPYLRWCWRTRDFTAVMKRRTLDPTGPARMLLKALRIGMVAQIAIGSVLLVLGILAQAGWLIALGALVVLSYPVVWAHLVVVPLALGRWFIIQPRQHRAIQASEQLFAKHKAIKIAIAGSYGKTTMKELLVTVLSEEKRVVATPGNKNVAISHAALAKRLTKEDEVIVIEYGEGAPGDIARFAHITHPDIGVITGLAPAHLDHYKTVEAAGEDLISLASFVDTKQLYLNGESAALRPFIKPAMQVYSVEGVLGWLVSDVVSSIEGISFSLKKGKQLLTLRSHLIGRHQVGPLAVVAVIAHELGLSKAAIERGISRTKPFEHRMEPRMVGGAWVIDDTYNGNIEGIRAGLVLLKELPAKRHFYVTPGLVDQGKETERIHILLGKLIAQATPDVVVLMRNSVTEFIQIGLQEGNYQGKLLIESDPLAFYSDLSQTAAAGDLVLMQNDWTDNYA